MAIYLIVIIMKITALVAQAKGRLFFCQACNQRSSESLVAVLLLHPIAYPRPNEVKQSYRLPVKNKPPDTPVLTAPYIYCINSVLFMQYFCIFLRYIICLKINESFFISFLTPPSVFLAVQTSLFGYPVPALL